MKYDSHFFREMRQNALRSARTLAPWLIELTTPKSVLDVGCGTGEWLSAFHDAGLNVFCGVDGDYVDRRLLLINERSFKPEDISKPLHLNQRFDLAICLEVAEHLPSTSALTLVESLTRHADVVLFSAAIPGQGGTNHINEQWPAYWIELFGKSSYDCFDIVRPQFWNTEQIGFIYRQNCFLFVRTSATQNARLRNKFSPTTADEVRALVHPDLFAISRRRIDAQVGFREYVKGLPWSLARALKARLATKSEL